MLAGDTDWETLLKNWMLANWIQSEEGILGYKNQISEITGGNYAQLTRHGFNLPDQTTTPLYAGEGVFTQTTSSPYTPPTGSGQHIKYEVISENTDTYLLTFNTNPDNSAPGSSETGYLADPITTSILSSKSVADSYTMPKSWPIGAGDLLARRGENVR
jgi:hypothetical protein